MKITDCSQQLSPIVSIYPFILSIDQLVMAAICTLAYRYESAIREKFKLLERFKDEQKHTQSILSNIYPEVINKKLQERKEGGSERLIFFEKDCVSVLFVDVLNIKQLMDKGDAAAVVRVLDATWALFEQLCEKHRVKKLETVGKTFMACAGIFKTRKDHAFACTQVGVDMVTLCALIGIQVRVGINCGPVVAGVVGTIRAQFSLFGDTVNTGMCITTCYVCVYL